MPDTSTPETSKTTPRTDAFASIALWQFLSFILVICFVWVNEVLDLPALIFGVPKTGFSFIRGCILSAAVITAAVIAVGHTYEKQKSLIRKLLKTCLFCHRVKTETGSWMHVEEYFLQNFPVAVDHSACPDCEQMLESVKEHEDAKNKKEPGA